MPFFERFAFSAKELHVGSDSLLQRVVPSHHLKRIFCSREYYGKRKSRLFYADILQVPIPEVGRGVTRDSTAGRPHENHKSIKHGTSRNKQAEVWKALRNGKSLGNDNEGGVGYNRYKQRAERHRRYQPIAVNAIRGSTNPKKKQKPIDQNPEKKRKQKSERPQRRIPARRTA
jgi:hypothetical protein